MSIEARHRYSRCGLAMVDRGARAPIPALDKVRLGQVVDLVSNIQVGGVHHAQRCFGLAIVILSVAEA